MKMLERFWFGCGHCHGHGDSCPLAEGISAEGEQWLNGGYMAISAAVVFLLPLALAILAAWLFGKYGPGLVDLPPALYQLIGVPVGLFTGIGIAKVVTGRIIRKKKPDCGDS